MTRSAPRRPPALVLLHGLGRTPLSLARLARLARARGYVTHNLGYPSRRSGIRDHAERLAPLLAALAAREGPVGVVTHSLGGVLLRAAVAWGGLPPAAIRRAVMLAPPSTGSELADALSRSPLFRLAVGPCGPELRTGALGLPSALPAVPFDVGVVAGRRSLIPAWIFGGENDGKVAVERAAVAGMRDMVVVDRGHTWIMDAPEVVAHTFHFLDHGRFAPNRVPVSSSTAPRRTIANPTLVRRVVCT